MYWGDSLGSSAMALAEDPVVGYSSLLLNADAVCCQSTFCQARLQCPVSAGSGVTATELRLALGLVEARGRSLFRAVARSKPLSAEVWRAWDEWPWAGDQVPVGHLAGLQGRVCSLVSGLTPSGCQGWLGSTFLLP